MAELSEANPSSAVPEGRPGSRHKAAVSTASTGGPLVARPPACLTPESVDFCFYLETPLVVC